MVSTEKIKKLVSVNGNPQYINSPREMKMSWPFNFNVNWDTQILKAADYKTSTCPKTEWNNYETKTHDMQRIPPMVNDFEKTADVYQYERRFSTHRTSKIRRKTIDNDDDDMNAAAALLDTTSNTDFNYYKPYSYYETCN